jgi:hypothetical protein
MPLAWGLNIHLWDSGPHEGRTSHLLMNICPPGKVLQRQQVRPPGVHESQVS